MYLGVSEGPRTTHLPFLDGLPEEVCHVVSPLTVLLLLSHATSTSGSTSPLRRLSQFANHVQLKPSRSLVLAVSGPRYPMPLNECPMAGCASQSRVPLYYLGT